MMNREFYKGDIVPEENTIFVFGSNPEGRHGAGSARVALKKFGAVWGQGVGLQGCAYALPTTELRFDTGEKNRQSLPRQTIISHIKDLYDTARKMPNKKFKIAYRNYPDEVTLCGYCGRELQEMFNEAGEIPENIIFSEEWHNAGIL